MKTGVEIIAEERRKIICKNIRYSNILRLVNNARLLEEYASGVNKEARCVDDLAEAGALIAAEIDRLNGIK